MYTCMRSVICVLLFCVGSFAVEAQSGRQGSIDLAGELGRSNERIGALERRVEALEKLLSAGVPSNLQTSSAAPAPSVAKANAWQVTANWRMLKQGMTMEQVKSVLGDPHKVSGGYITEWQWSDFSQVIRIGYVRFRSGKVDSWDEP